MIFVTVGTQLPFDRLVRSVDLWAKAHPDIPVRAQIGAVGPGGYLPQHMESAASLHPADYNRLCREARLIVAHAGTGSFIKAQTLGTPILAMPRKHALGEHRNDHQLATAAHFAPRDGVIVVHDEKDLPDAIDNALSDDARPAALPPHADESLIAAIRAVVFPKD